MEKLIKYDESFTQNDFQGEVDKEPIFEFIDKKSKVIFSAPHSVRTFTSKSTKASDLFTGAIVMSMQKYSKIIRKKYTPFKSTISKFVQTLSLPEDVYFLDIHGMKQDVPFELAVGTGILPPSDYKKEIEIIKNLCEKYQISHILNHPDYHASFGFTPKMQEKGFKNILQLELRRDMRDFYKYEKNVLTRTLPFLQDLAENIDSL